MVTIGELKWEQIVFIEPRRLGLIQPLMLMFLYRAGISAIN